MKVFDETIEKSQNGNWVESFCEAENILNRDITESTNATASAV